MCKKEKALQTLLEQKLLPLFYHESLQISIAVIQTLYASGIRIIEYTNRGENALSNFTELAKWASSEMPDLLLGIGTIKNTNQASQYIDAGTDFIVCPTINKEVAAITQSAGLLWIPGCMTPTEIAIAEEAGAVITKLFPGNSLGPDYVNAIKELFPNMLFMPTGGVEAEEENLKAWFKSGVVAVGMGSKLISKEIVTMQNYEALKSATEAVLRLVKNVTTKSL